MPSIIHMSSGWTHIRFNNDKRLGFADNRCFVQLPPGFDEEVIPDRMIHEPDWNARRVNIWWANQGRKEYRKRQRLVKSASNAS